LYAASRNAQLTTNESRIPLVTAGWLNDVRAPRILGELTSEIYIGLTNDAVPTATPSRNRNPMSIVAFCENAWPRWPRSA
jgi:hypothetical protein